MVDDDPSIREYLTQVFSDQGHLVDSAENGAVALELARRTPYDCITMDLMMPVMDGAAAIQALKADPRTRDAPVLVLSILSAAHRSGGDGSLVKPVNEERLIAAVAELLRGPTSTESCLRVALGDQTDQDKTDHCELVTPEEAKARLGEGFSGVLIVPPEYLAEFDLSGLAFDGKVIAVAGGTEPDDALRPKGEAATAKPDEPTDA